MNLGDLVRYKERVWVVIGADEKRTRAATLLSVEGTKAEVPVHLDQENPEECALLANPSRDWRLLNVPRQPRLGRIQSVQVFDGRAWHPQAPYERWTMADPTQAGGSLFLHPEAPLVPGGLVKVEHQKGAQVVRVPVKVGTMSQRKAWAQPPPKQGPLTAYDRIADDDEA